MPAGESPDTLWCRSCSTPLESFRDGLESGGPLFLRLVATVASVVPGIGTGVAAALGAAASLAEGQSISDALVAGAMSALPGGPAWAAAGASARSLLDGERIDRAALAGVREAIRVEGGDLAAAAYDGLVAVAQGKSLQDAGFAGLSALAQGNTLAERGAHYAEAIARAVEEGRAVDDVLVADLAADVVRYGGEMAYQQIAPIVARLKVDPSMMQLSPSQLGGLFGVGEAMGRAARAIMRSGVEDVALRERIAPRPAHTEILADLASTNRQVVDIARAAVRTAAAKSFTATNAGRHAYVYEVFGPPAVVAAPIVAAPAPSDVVAAPSSSVASSRGLSKAAGVGIGVGVGVVLVGAALALLRRRS